MVFNEQVEKLVTRLTDLSHAGKVKWSETGDRDTFLASISKYSVTIGKIGSAPDAVTFQFRVFDSAGRMIEESTVSAEDAAFDPYAGTPAEALRRFAELHSLGSPGRSQRR